MAKVVVDYEWEQTNDLWQPSRLLQTHDTTGQTLGGRYLSGGALFLLLDIGLRKVGRKSMRKKVVACVSTQPSFRAKRTVVAFHQRSFCLRRWPSWTSFSKKNVLLQRNPSLLPSPFALVSPGNDDYTVDVVRGGGRL